MSAPTVTLSQLASRVGAFLGYGRGPDFGDEAWDARKQANIDAVLESGLYKFYFPPRVGVEPTAHSWSFLKPTTTLTLDAAASAIQLPADFNGLTGEVVVYTPTSQTYGDPVRQINPVQLDMLAAQNSGLTGVPQFVAERPLKGTDRGQRYQLAVYPTADQAYTLRVAYTIAPAFLTATNPYPYGGPTHRETLIQACLSEAEAEQDDNLGLHQQKFMQCLEASVSHDRKFQPRHLGYNGDGPGEDDVDRFVRRWPTVTLAGQ